MGDGEPLSSLSSRTHISAGFIRAVIAIDCVLSDMKSIQPFALGESIEEKTVDCSGSPIARRVQQNFCADSPPACHKGLRLMRIYGSNFCLSPVGVSMHF